MPELDTHRRAIELFKQACGLEPAKRADFLRENCGEDLTLLQRVQAMLERDAGRDSQFEQAAGMRLLAQQIASVHTGGSNVTGPWPAVPMLSGQYRIMRLIGEGGMGAVYEAEQARPRRSVALKMIRQGSTSLQTLRRFEREADLLGRLHHPGIAQIFEAGAAEQSQPDQAYIAMEYVRGEPITAFAQRHALPIRARVELFIKVCDAVQHAHLRGVIHRDLKPANILVTADAQPKVLDFGVARPIAGDHETLTLHTEFGQLLGTIPYMSPEQIGGNPNDVDTRTDVYALGVILFQLLTGDLPHDTRSKSLPESARIIREVPPRRVSDLNRALRGDLETIVAKALEKEPALRYAAAADLAADLSRWLHDEPIDARRDSALYVLSGRIRRYRRVFFAGAVVVTALGALATVVFFQALANARLARAERLAAADARRSAEHLADELSSSRIERGRLMAATGNFRLAEDSIWPEWLAHPKSAHAHWALWELYSHHPCLATLPGPALTYRAVACSPDGRLAVGAGRGKTVHIWDLDSRRLIDDLAAHDPDMIALRFTPDGTHLVAGGSEGWIDIWRVSDHKPARGWSSGLPRISTFAISRDGEFLAAAGGTDVIQVWSTRSGALAASCTEANGWINGACFGPRGELWTTNYDGSVRHRSPTLLTESVEFTKYDHPISAPTISADGTRLAVARENNIDVWDVESGKLVYALEAPGASVHDICFTPDGARLIAAGFIGLYTWDLTSGRSLGALGTGQVGSFQAALRPGSENLVTVTSDGFARIWELTPNLARRLMHTTWRRGLRVRFSPDGKLLAATSDKTVGIWDVAAGRQTAALTGHDSLVRAAIFTPDGKILLTGGSDRFARIWDVASAKLIREVDVGGMVSAMCVAVDGAWFATCGGDQPVQLWETGSGNRIGAFDGSACRTGAIEVSPDGRLLAFVAQFQPVTIWDIASRTNVKTLGAKEVGYTVAWSPDGKKLASSDWTGEIHIWDIASGAVVSGKGHLDSVLSLVFSADGALLFSGSHDGRVKIWDPAEGECWATLEYSNSECSGVALDASGRYLAAIGQEDYIALWDLKYYDQHIEAQRAWFESRK